MTDKETIIAMLDKAQIPWEDRGFEGRNEDVPEGSTSIATVFWTDADKGQPYLSGYAGFFTEFVFGPAGDLIAVWAWE